MNHDQLACFVTGRLIWILNGLIIRRPVTVSRVGKTYGLAEVSITKSAGHLSVSRHNGKRAIEGLFSGY